MTKGEKQTYLSMLTEGFTSSCGGIEVKKIEYGIEDYVIFVAGCLIGKQTVHRVKIHHGDNPYFNFNGSRIYFACIYRW